MKKIYLLLTLLVAANGLYAQKYTATFDDGTKVDYEVVENELNQMHKWAVELLTTYDVGYELISLYYHQPDKFRVSATYGFNTYGADGIYYLTSWTKDTKLNIPLKSSYTGANEKTTYYAKVDGAKKTFYMGPHAAFSHKIWDTDKIEGSEVNLGWALCKGRHAKWIIQGRKRPVSVRGTSFGALIFDVSLFTGLKNIATTETTAGKPIGDISRPYGARLVYEGRTGFVSHREFGFHYSLGAAMSANKKTMAVAGLGFYFGF